MAGGALQVFLFELTSVTVAHTRALTRAFRNRAGNFLLVLTDDYERIDFVLPQRQVPDPGSSRRGVIVRPRTLSVDRRDPGRVALRVLRRFTFSEYTDDGRRDPAADAYSQWDKLNSAYTVAEWSEPLFNNRALFSDYYLNQRLPELDEWNAPERNRAFRRVRGQFAQARRRFADADTFDDLSEHGKWGSSLWKDPACRPYVDQESRSTRHLDESLGWDRDCYEAFAGMLAGKTSVTGPIIDVYREHHPPYKHLVERITLIFYRLQGGQRIVE